MCAALSVCAAPSTGHHPPQVITLASTSKHAQEACHRVSTEVRKRWRRNGRRDRDDITLIIALLPFLGTPAELRSNELLITNY